MFGNDLDENDRVAAETAEVVGKLPGAAGTRLVVPTRQPPLHIELEPEAMLLL